VPVLPGNGRSLRPYRRPAPNENDVASVSHTAFGCLSGTIGVIRLRDTPIGHGFRHLPKTRRFCGRYYPPGRIVSIGRRVIPRLPWILPLRTCEFSTCQATHLLPRFSHPSRAEVVARLDEVGRPRAHDCIGTRIDLALGAGVARRNPVRHGSRPARGVGRGAPGGLVDRGWSFQGRTREHDRPVDASSNQDGYFCRSSGSCLRVRKNAQNWGADRATGRANRTKKVDESSLASSSLFGPKDTEPSLGRHGSTPHHGGGRGAAAGLASGGRTFHGETRERDRPVDTNAGGNSHLCRSSGSRLGMRKNAQNWGAHRATAGASGSKGGRHSPCLVESAWIGERKVRTGQHGSTPTRGDGCIAVGGLVSGGRTFHGETRERDRPVDTS